MSAHDYDDTDMTSEEFELAMASGAPADVTNLGGRTVGQWLEIAAPGGEGAMTASSGVTRRETVRLAGTRDTTITGHLELAGT